MKKDVKMNFVFVSLQPINTGRDSTSTSLAKELAKNHNVLYVNSPIDRKTYYSKDIDHYTKIHIEAIKNKSAGLTKLEENLWVLQPGRIIESINWLPFTSLFKICNWFNNKTFAKDIKEALKELKFDSFIIINDKDIFRSYYLKEFLKPDKYIYLDRDYTLGVDYWKKHGMELEPALMKKSDAVVCNSYDFTNRAKQYNLHSYYIGNGFDVMQYNGNVLHSIPDELKNIPEPRIGYVGALITLRLDLALMIDMAKSNPTFSYILIGWEDDDFKKSELHKLTNVYFLGKKHTKDIPAYIQYSNVCINPQVINEITKSNFPLKVVEYLAMGKPVVATGTNTMRELFSKQSYLANGTEAFKNQVQKALLEDNLSLQEERKTFAKGFSWENVAKALLDSLVMQDKGELHESREHMTSTIN